MAAKPPMKRLGMEWIRSVRRGGSVARTYRVKATRTFLEVCESPPATAVAPMMMLQALIQTAPGKSDRRQQERRQGVRKKLTSDEEIAATKSLDQVDKRKEEGLR